MHRSSTLLSVPVLMGLSLVLASSCVDREGLGDPDASTTGKAGTTGSAGTGATGKAGTTGAAGTGATGAAGTGATGSAGMTGAGGTGATGKAGTTGTTGVAGTSGTGVAGTSGTAGTGGKAGTGGTMCGPLCEIFCPYGNVVDAAGCPKCACNPAPVCKLEECGPQARIAPPICNGKPTSQSCTRDPMTGKCGWVTPMCACDSIACGKIGCPYGFKVNPMTGCSTCECNPAPGACTLDMCPGIPPADYSMTCADGTVMKPSCGRAADGMCVWTFPKCPPPVCPAVLCLRACPNGSRPDANGCQTCDCIEPKTCGAFTDWKSCTVDMRCTWLQPGCGSPSLATPGCYSRDDVGCQSDGDCAGRTCLKRVIDPCFNPAGGASCDACGQTQTVCL